ncbi:MAG: D-aminoacyl-tRNA deacylase [Candidatus Woesearchaeota archaeon]
MKIALIVSQKDIAGINTKEELLRLFSFKRLNEKFENNFIYEFNNIILYTTNKDSVDCENVDKKIEADIFVFATKHKSESGIPSLSVHAVGNWGKAELGGKDKKLCVAPAFYLKEALMHLEEYNTIGFDVVQECTHHGPYIEKPAMFIEIGSSEKEWGKKEAATIIAKTIIDIFSKEPSFYKTAFGVGGLHTTPNFKKIMLKTDIAVGHICPKYQLQNLTEELIKEAIKKTEPIAEFVILDWKGLGDYKTKIVGMLNNLKINFIKTSNF